MKLKNYFQIGIGIGLFIALIGSVVWIKNGYSSPPVAAPEEPLDPNDVNPDTRLEEDIAAKEAARNADSVDVSKKNEPVDLAKASEFFAQGLRQMSACLGIKAEASERVEPTYANLLAVLKPTFEEPIMQSEDWVVWSLKAGGEDRRIRIETDYSDGKASSRNLRYFKIDEQGTPSFLPLTEEQSKNPSDALIASLKKDGTVYQEEKGLRSYFENGQELTVTERDGKIDDLELTNGPKSFRCSGVLKSSPSCKCY